MHNYRKMKDLLLLLLLLLLFREVSIQMEVMRKNQTKKTQNKTVTKTLYFVVQLFSNFHIKGYKLIIN